MLISDRPNAKGVPVENTPLLETLHTTDVCRELERAGIAVTRPTVCKSLDRLFGRLLPAKYRVRTLSRREVSISVSVFTFVHRCGLTRAAAEDLWLNRESLTARWRALAETEPDDETRRDLAAAADLLAGPVWENNPDVWTNPASRWGRPQAELVVSVFNRVNRPTMDFNGGGGKEASRTEGPP